MLNRIDLLDTEYAALVDAGLDPENSWIEKAALQVRQQDFRCPDEFNKAVMVLWHTEAVKAWKQQADEDLGSWPWYAWWVGKLVLEAFSLEARLFLLIARRFRPYRVYLLKKLTPLLQKLISNLKPHLAKFTTWLIEKRVNHQSQVDDAPSELILVSRDESRVADQSASLNVLNQQGSENGTMKPVKNLLLRAWFLINFGYEAGNALFHMPEPDRQFLAQEGLGWSLPIYLAMQGLTHEQKMALLSLGICRICTASRWNDPELCHHDEQMESNGFAIELYAPMYMSPDRLRHFCTKYDFTYFGVSHFLTYSLKCFVSDVPVYIFL